MGTLQLRHSESKVISCNTGDTLFQTLLRNHIPPHSVVVFSDDQPVPLFQRIQPETEYEVRVLEEYDYAEMQELYRVDSDFDGLYQFRRLQLTPSELSIGSHPHGPDELVESVEGRLLSVIDEHDLIEPNDSVLLAYSGGIDSSALLQALDSIRGALPEFELMTATLEDYWTKNDSRTRRDEPKIDAVDAHVVPSERITDVYNLNRSVTDVLDGIYRGDGDVLSIANNINRRMFEWFGTEHGVDKICIGDHSSDIIAGVLAEVFKGTERGARNVPRQTNTPVDYIYPLTYHTKRELYLYQYIQTGTVKADDGFDPWELNRPYRHYCYFLADLLQSYCPGLIYWMVQAASPDGRVDRELSACQNCGKTSRVPNPAESTFCNTCLELKSFGYLNRR